MLLQSADILLGVDKLIVGVQGLEFARRLELVHRGNQPNAISCPPIFPRILPQCSLMLELKQEPTEDIPGHRIAHLQRWCNQIFNPNEESDEFCSALAENFKQNSFDVVGDGLWTSFRSFGVAMPEGPNNKWVPLHDTFYSMLTGLRIEKKFSVINRDMIFKVPDFEYCYSVQAGKGLPRTHVKHFHVVCSPKVTTRDEEGILRTIETIAYAETDYIEQYEKTAGGKEAVKGVEK